MKNKTARLAVDVIMIIVGIALLIWGIKDAYDFFKPPKVDDNILFRRSYRSVPEDNKYRYINKEDVENVFEEGSNILILGKTTDPWMQVLVGPLNEIIKDEVDVIYYLEMDDLTFTEEEKINGIRFDNLSLPHIFVIESGDIKKSLGYKDIFDSDFDGAPIEYFDEEHKAILKDYLLK